MSVVSASALQVPYFSVMTWAPALPCINGAVQMPDREAADKGSKRAITNMMVVDAQQLAPDSLHSKYFRCSCSVIDNIKQQHA